MEIVTYSETRANLKAVMDRVVEDHVPIAITRQRGKPVVMVGLDLTLLIFQTLRGVSLDA